VSARSRRWNGIKWEWVCRERGARWAKAIKRMASKSAAKTATGKKNVCTRSAVNGRKRGTVRVCERVCKRRRERVRCAARKARMRRKSSVAHSVCPLAGACKSQAAAPLAPLNQQRRTAGSVVRLHDALRLAIGGPVGGAPHRPGALAGLYRAVVWGSSGSSHPPKASRSPGQIVFVHRAHSRATWSRCHAVFGLRAPDMKHGLDASPRKAEGWVHAYALHILKLGICCVEMRHPVALGFLVFPNQHSKMASLQGFRCCAGVKDALSHLPSTSLVLPSNK
jgi:hypothetical protein